MGEGSSQDRLRAAHRELAVRWEPSTHGPQPPSLELFEEAYKRHRARYKKAEYADIVVMLLEGRWPA